MFKIEYHFDSKHFEVRALHFMNFFQSFAKISIFGKKNFSPKKRRDMSIAFVPENRLGHSAVPELTLSENILLSESCNPDPKDDDQFQKYLATQLKE